ncbi:YtxH domain-containing protein [Geobacter sp. 60473]|uniref:YtxH domain-containing protein n=1 Tax=Geobacter sp. 60473 TaxID=3080755 RepID=UPI002B2B8F09|nr:YtxH domain-containing protein [Geobacter sp. 60473]
MSEERGTSVGTVFLSFLAGAAVGAGLGLLLAPKTGREMRENILDMTDEALDKIKGLTKEAQSKIKDTYEETKDLITEKKTIITSAIEAGKEAMDREREKFKEM